MSINKKRIAAILVILTMTFPQVMPVFAYQKGTSGSSSSGASSSGSGDGGYVSYTPPSSPPTSSDSVGDITPVTGEGEVTAPSDIGGGCNCNCTPLNNYTVYHPKVTILHNVNSLIAQMDKKSMYYIPTLNDLPFDLGDTALSVKEKDGTEHKFALVYKGLFDAEAAYSTVNSTTTTSDNKNYATFHTSKDLLSDSDTGSVAVNTIGADILLINENFTVKKSGSKNDFGYIPYVAGVSPLKGKEVVMDLYKALGIFEYRVQYTFSQDEEWDTNSSPILQELSVLTDTTDTDGLDISESRCDVSVSRTKPSYYWSRFVKDGVNIGVQYNDHKSLSNITHLDSTITKTSTVTLAQFMNMAVALMNLYGEASITAEELEQFDKAYPMLMNTSGELTSAEQASLKYLVIKGIIGEAELPCANWHAPVHLLADGEDDANSILTYLGRIANPKSRLSMREPGYVPPLLAEAGYVATNAIISDADVSEVVVKSQTELHSYDLLIEYAAPYTTDSSALIDFDSTRSIYIAYNDDDASATKDDVYVVNHVGSPRRSDQVFNNSGSSTIDREALIERNNTDEEEIEDTISSIGLLEATGTVKLSGLTPAPSLAEVGYKDVNGKTGDYYYMGTETFDGKTYYHFKIRQSLNKQAILMFTHSDSSATFYKTSRTASGDLQLSKYEKGKAVCNKKLTITGGGVLPLTTTKVQKFDDHGFDRSYIDYTDKASIDRLERPQSNEQYIYSFYVGKQSTMEKYFSAKEEKNTGIMWTEMIGSNGFKLNAAQNLTCEVSSTGKIISVSCLIEETRKADDTKVYFIQVITNDKAAVEKWGLLSAKLNKNKTYNDFENNEAYVLTTKDGNTNTMLRCEFLKSAGYINSYQEVSEDVFVLTVGAYNNNVVINKRYNFIIAGNTLILPKNREDIILYTKDKDKGWLICLEACLGWAGTYSYIRDSENNTIISNDALYDFDATTQTNSLRNVITFFPSISTKAMWTQYSDVSMEGFNLTSSYALAPYMLVMDMSQSARNTREDWLFVWHRQGATTSKGKTIKEQKRKDKFAREKLSQLLSTPTQDVGDLFETVDSKSYCLVAFKLGITQSQANLNHTVDKSTTNYVCGFGYHQKSRKGVGKDDTVTSGWVYNPPEFNTVTEALDAYANSVSSSYYYKNKMKEYTSKQDKCELPIPIFKCRGAYYDADVNFCGTDEGKYLPIGYMVGTTLSATYSGKIIKLTDHGNYQDDANHPSADGYTIYTAPVAQFSALKGFGTQRINDLRSGAIYFGTSRCRVSKGKLTLGDMTTSVPSDTPAVISFFSTGNNMVYSITTGTSTLSDILQSVETVLEYALTDPDNLVNWTNYQLTRQLANADAWSSVALIFVIQIMPRIVMFVFGILMLLSLVRDWKPWQKFCRNQFDVYSALTLGHQTVDTIELKKMFFVSLVCCILMVMFIYGNTLFDFMMFVGRFFIELAQR